MKKMVLGLSLAFVALVLIASSVWAETGAKPAARTFSAADQAFLASLAVKPVAKAPARPSGARGKALCAAAASCGSYSISCSGFNSSASCTAVDRNCGIQERGHVTCDGVTTWCNEQCIPTCEHLEYYCAQSCYPCNYNFSCDPVTGDDSCRCIFRTCPV
jgi:hypothetical protein